MYARNIATLAALAVSLTGCGRESSVAPIAQNPVLPSLRNASSPTKIYATFYSSDGSQPGTILVFPINASGNVPPSQHIAGAKTLLQEPLHVGISSSKNIFSSNYPYLPTGKALVLAYAPSATGNVAPYRTLDVPACRVMAVDAHGYIYAGNSLEPSFQGIIYVYPPNASGGTKPVRTIFGAKTTLRDPEGFAFDAQGRLWVGDRGQSAVLSFAANANGNVAPLTSFKPDTAGPTDLAFGPKGLYLNEGGVVAIYAPTASGYAQPSQEFHVGTDGAGAVGLGVDPAGNMYVLDTTKNAIEEYAPDASGNATPIRTIAGPKTAIVGNHASDLQIR